MARTIEKGREHVLILGVLMVAFELGAFLVSGFSVAGVVRLVLEVVLFALVYVGFGWARVVMLVLMALAAVLGPVTLAPPLLAIVSAGPQAMALALLLALPQLVWVQLYVAYCVVGFLTLALDDSVKALSARR